MKSVITYLAVLIAVVSLSSHSYAQTRNKILEGITRVDIIVEVTGESCGLTHSSLRSAAMFPVVTSKLTFDKNSFIYILIDVRVVRTASLCAGAVSVDVRSAQEVVIEATNLRKTAPVQL